MFGVGCIPWSVLGRGMLTRPVSELKSTARGQIDPWVGTYTGGGTADIINRSVLPRSVYGHFHA